MSSTECSRLSYGVGRQVIGGSENSQFNTDTDADDWQQLQRADDAGLKILFQRHKDYVFRLAYGVIGNHHLAEDVTQDVFLRIAKGYKRKLWQPKAKFRTWLYKLTLNTAREFKRKYLKQGDESVAAALEQQVAASQQFALANDLNRVLAALSDRQREVVILRYYEGLSTPETARVLNCRQGTVKSHLARATKILQQLLADSSS